MLQRTDDPAFTASLACLEVRCLTEEARAIFAEHAACGDEQRRAELWKRFLDVQERLSEANMRYLEANRHLLKQRRSQPDF